MEPKFAVNTAFSISNPSELQNDDHDALLFGRFELSSQKSRVKFEVQLRYSYDETEGKECNISTFSEFGGCLVRGNRRDPDNIFSFIGQSIAERWSRNMRYPGCLAPACISDLGYGIPFSREKQTPILKISAKSPERASEIRALFNKIDSNGDGKLSEEELRLYAAEMNLPTMYVREFLDQARYGWTPMRLPWSRNPPSAAEIPADCCPKLFGIRVPIRIGPLFTSTDNSVDFKMFEEFVNEKDQSLKLSFDKMDCDGDGYLTIRDLENGIGKLMVKCRMSGRFVSAKPQCIPKMMEKMRKTSQKKISFEEFRSFFSLLPRSDLLMDYWLDASCHASSYTPSYPSVDTSTLRSSIVHRSNYSFFNHIVAGGLAGALSRTLTAPIETLRLKMMFSGSGDLVGCARTIARNSGWRGFFVGNSTNVIRAVPQKAIDFFAFDAFKGLIERHLAIPATGLFAGAMAGATSTILLYPLDLVRNRITVGSGMQYTGTFNALATIFETEGVASLYRGLAPSVLSIIPEAALAYGTFDALKKTYLSVSKKNEVEIPVAMACGVTAAFLGQLVAFPLDLVARRMQTGRYASVSHALRTVMAEEGFRGLYRGIVPASLKVVPLAIVSFGVYETTKKGILWAGDVEARWRIERIRLDEERRERIEFSRESHNHK